MPGRVVLVTFLGFLNEKKARVTERVVHRGSPAEVARLVVSG